MSEKIVQLNEAVIKSEIKELVRGSVEETLNELLEAEVEKLTQAARYERNEQRQGYRSGHYKIRRCGQKVGLDTRKREIERCIQKNNITKLSRFMKKRNR